MISNEASHAVKQPSTAEASPPAPSLGARLYRATALGTSAVALLTLLFWLALALGSAALEEGSWWHALTYLPLTLVWLASLGPALAAFAFKRWRAAAALTCALGLASFTLLDLQLNPGGPPEGEPSLRVLTLNAHQGSLGFDAILHLILDADPDVIALQEASTRGTPDGRLPGFLSDALAETYACRHSGELLLCSRRPIISWEVVPIDGVEAPRDTFVEATLEHQGRHVRVLSAHLDTPFQPQHITPNDDNLARLQTRAERRAAQVHALMQRAEDPDRPPALLVGDFNTPPRGHRHRRITRHLQDAWAERGHGFGHTYVRGPLSTRIDYILAHPDVAIHDVRVRPEPVSDHRALIAELAWR